MTARTTEKDTIEQVLRGCPSIAIVGLSDNPDRPSYEVAKFLQDRGHRVIPVNPTVLEVLGRPSYPDLLSVPERVDVVDVFRRAEAVPEIVAQAIQIGAQAVWMQEGVINREGARHAQAAGLLVVMDHCIRKETMRLVAEGRLSRRCSEGDPSEAS